MQLHQKMFIIQKIQNYIFIWSGKWWSRTQYTIFLSSFSECSMLSRVVRSKMQSSRRSTERTLVSSWMTDRVTRRSAGSMLGYAKTWSWHERVRGESRRQGLEHRSRFSIMYFWVVVKRHVVTYSRGVVLFVKDITDANLVCASASDVVCKENVLSKDWGFFTYSNASVPTRLLRYSRTKQNKNIPRLAMKHHLKIENLTSAQ